METPSASRERATADRLGELPDGVLLEVLSRLTFRQAVRTGVLSRRWRGLWHAVPYPLSCIDIDQKRAFRGEKATRWSPSLDEERERLFRLVDYGDRVTTSGGAVEPLGAFRLRATDLLLFETAGRWIRRALTRRPMAVAIRCDASSPLFPARPEFSFARYSRGGGAFTCCLRALQLHRVTLGLDSDFADAIANELPVLEDLRFEECDYYFTRIASTSLQNLSIYNCAARVQIVDVFALAAPRISSLRIHGNPPPVASECEMPSLLAASLEHPAGFVGLLSGLRHARNLSLYGFGTTALLDGEEPGGFPEFRNLSALVFDECDVGVDCQVLRHFLRNSPGLETLALRYCSFTGGSRRKKRKARSSDDRRVPASHACKNLKSVELEYHDEQDVSELDDALEEISKKVARPIESSVQHGRRTVRISWPCIPTAYAAGTFTSRLRTLRLSGLSLTSNFADDLAAGFPVLEDM
ncbi:MEIOTIC F-BOX protein MOF-like [Panicum hallii]|uniref:MEIOTIC F-BOX protein MOF-like n=1 Tax=Panicum hallii TaxID=206008 RepID=UPI000DF4F0EE|nr:MEIOTIC F-BOX protein MOF-like [Panicum hallii]